MVNIISIHHIQPLNESSPCDTKCTKLGSHVPKIQSDYNNIKLGTYTLLSKKATVIMTLVCSLSSDALKILPLSDVLISKVSLENVSTYKISWIKYHFDFIVKVIKI